MPKCKTNSFNSFFDQDLDCQRSCGSVYLVLEKFREESRSEKVHVYTTQIDLWFREESRSEKAHANTTQIDLSLD